MGAEASNFLQGLLTNDMKLLDQQPALYAGVLTPQGKVLCDVFAVTIPGGYCLELARDRVQALVDRLKIYNLRSKVEIADASANYTVAAVWGGPYAPRGSGTPPVFFADPRLPELGYRELATLDSDWALGGDDCDSATQDEYHAHRISLGVPEGGRDYSFGDTFPHEAMFDQLNGVSFKKGCYVGQESVSRMQNRGTARKRIVPLVADAALPESGTPITAAGVEIGKLGSTAGTRGLAQVRIDRVAEFKEKGEALHAGEAAVSVELPPWATFTIEAKPAGSAA